MTCHYCHQAIPVDHSTFVVAANREHGELVFCSLACVDRDFIERQEVPA